MKSFWAIASLFFGVSLALAWAYVCNHNFFFMDDRQAQYFPYALAIQKEILHGRFPFQTLSNFYGGALWMDWQYGIFNPIELAKAFLVNPRDLFLSGLNVAIVSNSILAICAYLLGRAYSLSRGYSAVFGLAMGLNFYVLTWNSGNWSPGVQGVAYFCLSWAMVKMALNRKRISPGQIALGAGALYLMITSGWPHAFVSIVMVGMVLLVDGLLSRDRAGVINLCLTFLFGFLFTLPATMPVILSYGYAGRNGGFSSGHFQVPFLGGLLNFSNPFWLPYYAAWSKLETITGPYFYMAWFVMPLAIMIDWKKIRLTKQTYSLVAIVFLLLLLAVGPDQLGPIRWPIRFVPFVHAAALLLFFTVFETAPTVTEDRRKLWVGGFWLLSTWIAFVENPNCIKQILLALPVMAFSYAAFWILNRGKTASAIFLFATTLFMTCCLVATYPVNSIFPDFGKTSSSHDVETMSDHPFTDYRLAVGGPAKLQEPAHLPAAFAIYYNVDSINGYSALQHRQIRDDLCAGVKMEFYCQRGIEYLFGRGADSGESRLNLLKVKHLSASKGAWVDVLAKGLTDWKRTDLDDFVVFDREFDFRFPGTVAWASKNIEIKSDEAPTGIWEKFYLKNEGDDGEIVFTRLYWPGYHLTLNKVPLEIREMDSFFVGAKIPKGASGYAELSFYPPYFYHFLAVALVSFFFLLGWCVLDRRIANH